MQGGKYADMKLLNYRCKNNYVNIFLLGIITAFIIFLPFLIFDKGLFLYYGDFDVQQIPFYSLAHDSVRSGDVLWNWNTDLGVNFVGSYAFYLLGSPFFWITLLFPNAAVPYLMAPLLILKFGLTAVTAFAYINRFAKYEKTAMIGGLIYAFCGFNVYNIFFNHFNEVVLLFPLLLIALEELVINNRRGVFALTVAMCALINYYFFFGEVIFVVIYFCIRCASKDFNITLKCFFVIAFEAIVGLLMSAILLLPGLLAILDNPRTGDTLMGFDMLFYGNTQRYGLILSSFFFPPDIPARPNLFPDSNAKWSSVSMYLPLLSTVGVFAFFKGFRKHWAKILIGVCIFISLIPILNSSFSAFNYSYYARWFFMPLLIMTMVSCLALEGDKRNIKFGLITTSVIVGLFTFIGILPKKENGEIIFFKLPAYPERFWAYIAIACIGLLLTGLLYTLTIKHKKFMRTAIIGVMMVSVIYSCFMIYTGKLSGEGYDVIAQKALYGREKLQLEGDDKFFRIDTYDELDNLGMYWRIPTINAFHSVVPPSIMDYYESVGEERGVASRPDTKYLGIRALTSVKYSFVKEGKSNNSPMFGFGYYDTQNGYAIYQNNYFIPMGFTYNYLITDHQLKSFPSNHKDRLLLQGLLLEDKDYEKYKNLLPILPNEQASDDVLGDNENYSKACHQLASNAGYYFKHDNKGFTSKVSSDQKNLMFFSVPYDKGWSATVNNNSVEILKANNGFMAVPIPEGGSIIRFDYKTPGATMGIVITLSAIGVLVVYLVLVRRYRLKYPDKNSFDRYRHLKQRDVDIDILAHDAYINKVTTNKSKKPTE